MTTLPSHTPGADESQRRPLVALIASGQLRELLSIPEPADPPLLHRRRALSQDCASKKLSTVGAFRGGPDRVSRAPGAGGRIREKKSIAACTLRCRTS